MIVSKDFYCTSCKRITTQINGYCKWCNTPGSKTNSVIQPVQEQYISWKKTYYLYECPGCGKKFRYVQRYKDHKKVCILL